MNLELIRSKDKIILSYSYNQKKMDFRHFFCTFASSFYIIIGLNLFQPTKDPPFLNRIL